MTDQQLEAAGFERLEDTPRGSALAAALARVQAELPSLGKSETGKVSGVTKDGKAFSYEYKYADLAAISDKILPLLGRNGLAFTCFPGFNPSGALVLRYELVHESGESKVGEYPIGGNTAQALGSSITYARRYCLCAVTGVAPDKDDDGAAVASAQSIAPPDPELEEARAKVRGAWQFQYGELITSELAQAYNAWSVGGDLWQAAPGDLRRYAAYLSNLPKEEAGGDPADAASNREATPAEPMTPRMRGQLFALMGEIGKREKGEQLAWINSTLGTSYESRSLVTREDAGILIEALKKGSDVPPSEPA